MPALSIAKAGDVVGIPLDLRPLRVLKQIIVMFCSACGPNFIFPELARYLLNRDRASSPRATTSILVCSTEGPGHHVKRGSPDDLA